jgi:hypothetical protein
MEVPHNTASAETEILSDGSSVRLLLPVPLLSLRFVKKIDFEELK